MEEKDTLHTEAYNSEPVVKISVKLGFDTWLLIQTELTLNPKFGPFGREYLEEIVNRLADWLRRDGDWGILYMNPFNLYL